TVTFDPVVTSQVRVVVTNPNPARGNGSYVGISELDVRNTANLAGNRLGADAPFGTPVPSASSDAQSAWRLVDGDVREGWQSSDTGPWVGIDLLRSPAVDTVSVYLGSSAAQQLRVQYWTGGTWSDVQHLVAGRPAVGRNELSFDTVNTRRIRVLITPSAG